MIVDKLLSFEFNKIKMQFTTPTADSPAYDVLLDFTLGKMYMYNNLTSECQVFGAPQFDLGSFYKDIVANHTELAGKRGSNLYVYEMKVPMEGSRTWIYGMWVKDEHHSHETFIPTRFQSHHFEEQADYAGEWIDTIKTPTVTESNFHYPQCENVEPSNLQLPISLSPMSVNLPYLKKLNVF